MSYAARLVHPLTLAIPHRTAEPDEYGQPTATDVELVELRGLVQPKTVDEIALVSQAGAEIGDHTIFLLPREIPTGAYFTNARGERLDVRGVRRYEFGRTPHLEIDARLVRSEPETEGS